MRALGFYQLPAEIPAQTGLPKGYMVNTYEAERHKAHAAADCHRPKDMKREPPRTKHKGDAGGAATGQKRDGAERFLPHAQADCPVCTCVLGPLDRWNGVSDDGRRQPWLVLGTNP